MIDWAKDRFYRAFSPTIIQAAVAKLDRARIHLRLSEKRRGPRTAAETAIATFALLLIFLGFCNTFLWPHPDALQVPHGFYWDPLEPYAKLQMGLSWAAAGLLLAWSALRGSAVAVTRAVLWFVPLLTIAALSALLSADLLRSALFSLAWGVILGSGAAAGSVLSYRAATTALLMIGATLFVACAIVHFQAPLIAWSPTWPQKIGTQFSGVFVGKQVCGWVAASLFIVATCAHRAAPGPLRALVAAAAVLVVWLSDSQIALVCAAASSLAFGLIVPALKQAKIFSPRLLAVLLVVVAVAAAVTLLALAPGLAEILGRNDNLDARARVWAAYSEAIEGHGVVGLGPGAFAQGGIITTRLFYENPPPNWWQSPHSLYLNFLGEVGWIGVAALLAALGYITFIRPAVSKSSAAYVASGLGLQLLVGGLVEPSDGVFPGHIQLSLFLILLFHAVALERERPPPVWRR